MNLKIQEAVNGFIILDVGSGFGEEQLFRMNDRFPAAWVAETPAKLSQLVTELAPINSFREYQEKYKAKLEEEFKLAAQIAREMPRHEPEAPRAMPYDEKGKKTL